MMNQENYYHKSKKQSSERFRLYLSFFKHRGSRAFTIVELLIAAGLLSVFLLGIGTFFLQGNKAAAKGTWRVHTVEKMRLGMSLLRRALDGTSYPSYTSNSDFLEFGPEHDSAGDYDLNFAKDFSKESTTPVTFVAGIDEFIVGFTTVTPYQLDEVGNSVPGSGLATAYTIALNLDNSKTVIDSNKGTSYDLADLTIEGQEQVYTYTAGTPPALDFIDQPGFTRIRIPDVHQVSFRVAKSYPNPEYEGTKSTDFPRITLEIYIECRDPFDGRLAVTQTLVYMINTQVRGGSGAAADPAVQ